MDKYCGSGLATDSLVKTLTDFLYNGNRYRLELLPQLIEKLRELREVIRHLDSYRLFSSSLLIMYEGEDPLGSGSGRTLVQNGCAASEEVLYSSEEHLHGLLQSTECFSPDFTQSVNNQSNASETNTSSCSCYTSMIEARELVDIRMIDFGNVTNKKFESDPIKYDGPDEGYIFGLTNIINVFEDFLKIKH